MVAEPFTNFFTTMAVAGATLLSLIYIGLSMRRGPTLVEGTQKPADKPLEEQLSDALLVAMVGGFVVSAAAILPGVSIGRLALAMACISVVLQALSTARLLFARRGDPTRWRFRAVALAPTSIATAVSILQLSAGLQLIHDPRDTRATTWLGVSVLCHYAYTLLRSWMLIGGAERGLRSVFDPVKRGETQRLRQRPPTEIS
jgi:uncharacterized membrane protein